MKTTSGMILAVLMSASHGNSELPNADDKTIAPRGKESASDRQTTRPTRRIIDRAKAILNRCAAGDEYQALVEYYLGYADYRLGVVVYRMDKEKAIVYLDSAVEHLERAIDNRERFCRSTRVAFELLRHKDLLCAVQSDRTRTQVGQGDAESQGPFTRAIQGSPSWMRSGPITRPASLAEERKRGLRR